MPSSPATSGKTHADITRAARDLGYDPSTTLREGLARFVEWYRSGPA